VVSGCEQSVQKTNRYIFEHFNTISRVSYTNRTEQNWYYT